MTARTCGQCIHTETAGANVVWCHGAPPTVISAKPAANGGIEVSVQAPLVPVDRRACAVFRRKPKPKVRADASPIGTRQTEG
jgi:hypothetical protein